MKTTISECLDLKPGPRDPKLAALAGPLELKEPGSEAWAIQITHKAQGILVSLDRDTSEWLDVVRDIEAQRIWERFPKETPYGTREAYFLGAFGKPEPELTRAKKEQQDLQKHGGDRHSEEFKIQLQSRNTRLKSVGESETAAYIRARLERDGKAELLARIQSGELSAHAAAIEAGIRQRLVQHAPTVDGFVRAAQRHLSAAEQRAVAAALQGEVRPVPPPSPAQFAGRFSGSEKSPRIFYHRENRARFPATGVTH